MAIKNRPVIGTVHCEHCDGTRSLHLYENGRHKGKIYTRCPSCEETAHKFISKTSHAEQRFLRSKATFKPEFAELAFTEEKPATPKPEQVSMVEEPADPKLTPNDDPKPQSLKPRKGLGVVLALLGGVALFALGAAQ